MIVCPKLKKMWVGHSAQPRKVEPPPRTARRPSDAQASPLLLKRSTPHCLGDQCRPPLRLQWIRGVTHKERELRSPERGLSLPGDLWEQQPWARVTGQEGMGMQWGRSRCRTRAPLRGSCSGGRGAGAGRALVGCLAVNLGGNAGLALFPAGGAQAGGKRAPSFETCSPT